MSGYNGKRYKGKLHDVFKEDTVTVCGLPLGLTSFENVGSGSTIAVILASEYALYDLDTDGGKC